MKQCNTSSSASATHRLNATLADYGLPPLDLLGQRQAPTAVATPEETITRTTTASVSYTLTTTAVPVGSGVVPDMQVDFSGNAPLHLEQVAEQPASAPVQAPPARAKPSVPAGTSSKPKIDKESREVLRYISEDFIFLAGKTPAAYHIASGDEMGKESFRHYCAKHYGDVVFIDDEGKEKRADAGPIWWEWNDPERRVVRRIVMEPTEKDESEDDPEVYNRWHVLKHTMVEPDLTATDKDIGILLRHLLYIAGGDVVGVAFFLNWLAWLYLHPGAKMPTAILMYSKYGRVGKSMLHRLLATIYGPTMVASTTGKALSKSFDDVVEHKRLVVVNEMASAEKKDGYETFKNMVSEPVVTFEGKGRAAKEVANSAHYIVTTNNDDALPLMENDGRVLVMRCLEERKDDFYYRSLGEWIDGPGPALLAGMFEKWTFTADWDPHAPVPQTEGSKAMQVAARGALYSMMEDLRIAKAKPFDRDILVVSEVVEAMQGYGHLFDRAPNLTSVGKVLKLMPLQFVPQLKIDRKLPKGQTGPKPLPVYLQEPFDRWKAATPKQRGEHLDTGARLFPVQDQTDEGEVASHE